MTDKGLPQSFTSTEVARRIGCCCYVVWAHLPPSWAAQIYGTCLCLRLLFASSGENSLYLFYPTQCTHNVIVTIRTFLVPLYLRASLSSFRPSTQTPRCAVLALPHLGQTTLPCVLRWELEVAFLHKTWARPKGGQGKKSKLHMMPIFTAYTPPNSKFPKCMVNRNCEILSRPMFGCQKQHIGPAGDYDGPWCTRACSRCSRARNVCERKLLQTNRTSEKVEVNRSHAFGKRSSYLFSFPICVWWSLEQRPVGKGVCPRGQGGLKVDLSYLDFSITYHTCRAWGKQRTKGAHTVRFSLTKA